MIESIYLTAIIILLLAWIFEGKVFPQIVLIFLNMVMMIKEIQTADSLKTIIPILLIDAVLMVYSGIQILYGEKGE